MRRTNLYAAVLLAVFLTACASVKSPEGGPRDTTPPYLIKSNPQNHTTSFKSKSIILEFSEDVEENNTKQQIISPYNQVTINPLGKKLKITTDSGWQPNTTYSILLKKKIKDAREGNPLKDTLLLFSTGEKADTNHLQVEIVNLSGKKSSQPFTALLHKQVKYTGTSDSLQPIQLAGLRPDTYLLEVFTDKNDNYSYDEEDGVLFTDSLVLTNSQTITVKPLPQKYKPLQAFKQRKGDTCTFESNSMVIPDGRFKDKIIAQSEDKTQFWLFPVTESFTHTFSDSLRNCFEDTINLKTIDTSRSLVSIPLRKKVKLNKENKALTIHIQWNWAIHRYPNKLEITQDSVWQAIEFKKEKQDIQFNILNPSEGKLKIRYDTLSFYNKTGINKDSIDILKSDLEPKGSVSGNVESKEYQHLIVELINSSKEIVARSTGKKFSYQVAPGKYTLQAYLDLDSDGFYTGGNKKARRKAEPLYVYPEPVELKPGWDLEDIEVKTDL